MTILVLMDMRNISCMHRMTIYWKISYSRRHPSQRSPTIIILTITFFWWFKIYIIFYTILFFRVLLNFSQFLFCHTYIFWFWESSIFILSL
jgi:hypothetical protein